MALTSTTLAAAVAAQDLVINVASATGATVGGFVQIDDEYMYIVAIDGTALSVRQRGFFGSQAKAHTTNAPVLLGLTSDLPAKSLALPPDFDTVTINAAGAIPVPTGRNGRVIITGGSALALTLAGPSKADNGIELEIVNATAYAHTVTYTPGFYGDTTSSDVATSAASAGTSLKMVAQNGIWRLIANFGFTLA